MNPAPNYFVHNPELKAWTVVDDNRETPAIDGRYLVMNLRDVYRTDDIVKDGIVQKWAEHVGFSLQGIQPRLALIVVLDAVVFAADKELRLNSRLISSSVQVIQGRSPIPLPDFRVALDAMTVGARLVELFDGPFQGNRRATMAAIARRTGRKV